MQIITSKKLLDTMYYRDIPVFIYQINYPSFTTTCNIAAGESINTYYAQLAKSTEAYCRNVLFPQAVNDMRYTPVGPPVNSYTLNVVYEITFNHGCITSLYTDTHTYMGGALGETTRTSDTWDFNTGKKLHLADIYPLTPASLHKLQASIEQQIGDRLSKIPGSYFDDYKSLLSKTFHVNQFYLRPGSVVLYYQQYDLAPYAAGLPEFSFHAAL